MLKKLRRRFILSAMLAFSVVTIAVITAINLFNYHQMELSQEDTLDRIHEYEQERASSTAELPPISEMPWAGGSESEFTIRFFVVQCDENGKVSVFGNDYISSVNEETAEQYTQDALNRRQESGIYEDYRYRIFQDNDHLTLIFLHIGDAVRYRKNLLLLSILIGLGSLTAGFLLILLLSGRAIRPFAKNIEQQKQFITDAGHELKTPLTSIATSAEIAAMEYGKNEWIDNICRQSARMSHLVNDLITLSRMDEENPFPDKTEFSLSEAAWEIAEPVAVNAAAQKKQYSQQIEDDLTFYGDRNAIQRMISILLDNALKYSDPGGEIRLTIARVRGRISIEVYNTCILPDNLDLNRLFDRFYRPDSSRSLQTGGSGIGLSIARAAVENHGGHIRVSSFNGRSILFQVLL